MKIKLTALLIFASGLLNLIYSQTDFDKRIERTYDCSDISASSAKLFENFYLQGELDSAQQVIDYWSGKCGFNEPVKRAQILLALTNKSYTDSVHSKELLYYIYNYQDRMAMYANPDYYAYEYYKPYFGYIPPRNSFDDFTKEAASLIRFEYSENTIENLLCEFYSSNSDTIFYKIQDEQYAESLFRKEYFEEVNRYLKKSDIHMAWITGMWIPTNELKSLGIHPEMGFMIGGKTRRINYDLIMAFKFGKAKEPYLVKDTTGNFVTTEHFFGGYIGMDLGYDIWVKPNNELQLIGGIAFDGFDAIKSDLDNDKKGVSVNTLNLNLGVGYRYYLKSSLYLGLRGKYNFVDYSSTGKVDMKGNTISIQFIVGGIGGGIKDRKLKTLKYKYRSKNLR